MNQYAYDPYAPASRTNGLGIAGFICSLIGLVSGGVLSPIGLILSIVALGREPRGFAIAGVVLGIIGTCGGILLVLIFGTVILAALGIAAVAIALSEPQRLEMTSDMITTAIAVERYREENRYLPASLTLLGLPESTLTDPWNTHYRYEQIDVDTFDLVSAGEDGTFGTEDDIRLSELGDEWFPAGHVQIQTDDGTGAVRVRVGENRIEVIGSDEGGNVTIKAGDRIIEVKGDGSDPSENFDDLNDIDDLDIPEVEDDAGETPAAPEAPQPPSTGE